MKYYALALISLALLSGCEYINQKLGLEDDNLAEEIVEEIIEQKFDVDIDLSPSSKELFA